MVENQDHIDVKLTGEVLLPDDAIHFVEGASAGGTCVFIGTVRNVTQGRPVRKLEFEAYEPMAVSEMMKIANTAMDTWPLLRVAIHHRIGTLDIGAIPVIIAVAAGHRQAAFEACQYCIDTLKETVPIWKKEIFDDGEVWVSAHP